MFRLNVTEGGFFSESQIRFSNLQISKKKNFQKTILDLKFKFPANFSILLLAGNLNFKFRIVFLEYFFLEIWRFEKQIALSEKKATFTCYHLKALVSARNLEGRN